MASFNKDQKSNAYGLAFNRRCAAALWPEALPGIGRMRSGKEGERYMGREKERKIYVVGHKNPDTDSICSAIVYAALKTKLTGRVHEPRRAGQLNEETQYVLEALSGRNE